MRWIFFKNRRPYLINNNPELNVSVLNADFGLGLVSKKKNIDQKFYQFPDDIQEYKGLQYSYLKTDKQNILNLRDVEELEAIIDIHLNKWQIIIALFISGIKFSFPVLFFLHFSEYSFW